MVLLQALYRGRNVRKVNAATKIQSYRRMYVRHTAYKKLKSATIALQCCARRSVAKKLLDQLKREQKDMGKVKEQNEKLKTEMASLKAMLQAQAASSAGKAESAKAVAEKQKEIDELEARIKVLEAELEKEKENVKRLENDLNVQMGNAQRLSQDLQHQKTLVQQGSSSPKPLERRASRKSISTAAESQSAAAPEPRVVDAVSVALAQHHAEVARLEEMLDEERRMSRAARIEVKHLRAAITDKGMDATTSTEFTDNLSEISGSEIDKSDVPVVSDVEPQMRYVQTMVMRRSRVIARVWSFHFEQCV